MSLDQLFIHSFETKLGLIRTASTNTHLVYVAFPDITESEFQKSMQKLFKPTECENGGKINSLAAEQIKAYCNNELKAFDLPLHFTGTEFQQNVLRQVAKIKYGQTITYGEIAVQLEKPKASQAVGSAVGRNYIPIVIPCHRVLASNGIGGFSGGLQMKRKLLSIENSLQEFDMS